MKIKEITKIIKYAFPKTTPVLIGFFFVGVTWSILMYVKGYSLPWTTLMSTIAYCGSMQYASIILFTSTFNPLYALILSILINIRHIFYGISMLNKYNNMGKSKLFLIFSMCDETFSLLCDADVDESIDKKKYYLAVSILNYLYWIIATTVGSLIAPFISFNLQGIEFVLTALIVVIFFENWLQNRRHYSAIVGIVSSVIAILIFGKDIFIIPAMIIILILITAPYIYKIKKEGKHKNAIK